jgi:hypothetical protein
MDKLMEPKIPFIDYGKDYACIFFLFFHMKNK